MSYHSLSMTASMRNDVKCVPVNVKQIPIRAPISASFRANELIIGARSPMSKFWVSALWEG